MKGQLTVVLSNLQISDLFFGFEKPNMAEVYAGDPAPALDAIYDVNSEVHAALRKDAQAFSDITGVDVEWVVTDYLERV